jgi:hypothetical protein
LSPTATPTETPVPPAATSEGNVGEEGGSFETAVIIEASNSFEGIAAERQWFEARYPGCEKVGQLLTHHGDKVYDVITIITADGVEKNIYFDITAFYGKL